MTDKFIKELEQLIKKYKELTTTRYIDDPFNIVGTQDSCHVCGMLFKDMTHYVCNHPQCPNRTTCE